MWPFNRSVALAECGVFDGYTDWHSHILPGVDDGVRSMDDALAILSAYGEMGVRRVWLTPHIMEDVPNTPAGLRQRFSELSEAYTGPVELRLAAEHMLDDLFVERLTAGDVMPIGEEGNHLLVETSYFNPPAGMDAIIDRIMSAGYFPLLAHPERYIYMDAARYRQLHDRGVKFQINLPSLLGRYGNEAASKARWLLDQGYSHVTGTDIHRPALLDMLRSGRLHRKYITTLKTPKL